VRAREGGALRDFEKQSKEIKRAEPLPGAINMPVGHIEPARVFAVTVVTM
jgi:hypothetical protein